MSDDLCHQASEYRFRETSRRTPFLNSITRAYAFTLQWVGDQITSPPLWPTITHFPPQLLATHGKTSQQYLKPHYNGDKFCGRISPNPLDSPLNSVETHLSQLPQSLITTPLTPLVCWFRHAFTDGPTEVGQTGEFLVGRSGDTKTPHGNPMGR